MRRPITLSFFSWFRGRRGVPISPHRKPQPRLGFDALEDRLAPAVLTVNSNLDVINHTVGDTALTIREAIAVVNAGSTLGLNAAELAQVDTTAALGVNDTIQFSPSIAGQTIVLLDSSGGELLLSTSVSIDGAGVTLQRSSAVAVPDFRIVEVAAGATVTLTALTITNGQADVGGGILNSGTLHVSNSTLSGNAAALGSGGGINNVGTLTLTNSRVVGNASNTNGGGIAHLAGSMTITNSTISGNGVADQGGGIFSAGLLSVINSTLFGNTAAGSGGGISNDQATLTVTSCTIADNFALTDGGGIRNSLGTMTLINATLSGNSASENGGNIRNDGTLTVANSTITLGDADTDGNFTGSGGAISTANTATTTIQNTIVAGNFVRSTIANDLAGKNVESASQNNLVGDSGSAGGLTHGVSGNKVGVDPLLGQLKNNGGPTETHLLLPSSPAINGGRNAGIPVGVTTDQRGLPRITGALVDIGAVESQADVSVTMTGGNSTLFIGGQVTYIITIANTGPDAVTANLVDTFSALLTGVSFTSTASGGATGNTATGNGNLSESVTLPGGGSIQYTVTATVLSSASAGASLSNTATVTASADSNGANNSVINTATLIQNANLQVAMSATPSFVVPGVSSITYTITVTNLGPSDATAATLTDVLPASLRFGAMSQTSGPSFSFTTPGVGTTGTVTATRASFLTGAVAVFSLVVTVSNAAIGDVVNTATVSATSGDSNTGNNSANTTTKAVPLVVDHLIDENDGDVSAGNLSLREAINIANQTSEANTITFAAALAGQTIVLTGTRLVISDSVTITGPGADSLTIDGANLSQIFFVNSAAANGITVTIQNLALTRGRAAGTGGASDTSQFGGAIFNSKANLTLSGLNITNSSSTSGGGGAVQNGSGGGTLTLVGSTLSGNTALGASLGSGGAIANDHSTLVVLNSTLVNNRANMHGGGIFNDGGTLTMTNATVAGNRADTDGNNSGLGGGVAVIGTETINNSLVLGNFRGVGTTANDLDIGVVETAQNNLIGGGAAGIVSGVNGNIVGATLAAVVATNGDGTPALAANGGLLPTVALLSGSAAINAGKNSLVPGSITTDERGLPRVLGSTVDIGSYESTRNLVVDVTSDVVNGNFAAGDLSLREAVSLANSSVGDDTITFAATGTITLTAGELAIGDNITIAGPGAKSLAISGNGAGRIFNIGAGKTVAISGLTLQNGNAALGGAILNLGALAVSFSVLQSNSAATAGGAIRSDGGSLTISNSTISGNTAANAGGAISLTGSGAAQIANSTISGNSAGQNGGGIDVSTAQLTVLNSTVTLNRANTTNAAFNGGGIATVGTVTLLNTIVAGNLNGTAGTPDDLLNAVQSGSSNNLIGDFATRGGLGHNTNGNIVGNNGSGTLPIASILSVALADNGGPTRTHALVQNSLAIGAASASVIGFLPYDQRDAARDASAPDIGAYEVQHPLSPVGTPSTYARTFLPKPSSSANEAFVKGLYQSTLLRAPDGAGLAGWVAALNGGANRLDVAYGFVNSVENRSNQVTFFYKYFLGRNPDPAGLAGWVNILQTGTDEGAVMTGFLLSTEFTGQNDNSSFVNLMYYAILGRQADPAGFNGWVSQLNSGQLTREQVGNGFLRSVESITRVVVSDYSSYLKRTITSAAATPFVSQIQSGVTFGRVAANVLGSDEFFVNASNNLS